MSNFFSHDGAHRAAKKFEIKNDQNCLVAPDAAKSGGYRFADARLSPRLLQTAAVRFVVGKPRGSTETSLRSSSRNVPSSASVRFSPAKA